MATCGFSEFHLVEIKCLVLIEVMLSIHKGFVVMVALNNTSQALFGSLHLRYCLQLNLSVITEIPCPIGPDRVNKIFYFLCGLKLLAFKLVSDFPIRYTVHLPLG